MKESSDEKTDLGNRVMPLDDVNDEQHWVVCDYCDTDLELSDDELAQGWYLCPECGQLSHLAKEAGEDNQPVQEFPDHFNLDDWVTLTEVDGAEEAALVVSYLKANGIEALAWQEGAGRAIGLTVGMLGESHVMVPADQEQVARLLLEATDEEEGNAVKCIQCQEALELSEQEVVRGWYFCPVCHTLGSLGDHVTCLSCGSELELDEAEWEQGWYRCPECDQVTHLTE